MTWKDCYPRPQLRRDSFFPLTDGWTLNEKPIVMPFPPQSTAAAYDGEIGTTLVYRTAFTLPDDFCKARTLLRFGACDQVASVTLNGKLLGSHKGGYLPFSFDVTDVLVSGENVLVVDVTDEGGVFYPYGKQSATPHGIWYTAVSGIWQTVWLESVVADAIEDVTFTPTTDRVAVTVKTTAPVVTMTVTLPDNTTRTEQIRGGKTVLFFADDAKKCWTPDTPHLYPVVFTTPDGDRVESYFALREIALRRMGGKMRITLNNKPIFLNGVLDQGYFSDGIFLPADPDEFERDILRMKALGYNVLRKHIKIEPCVFYAACDRLGMLVFQDFVNNGETKPLLKRKFPRIWKRFKKDNLFPRTALQKFFLAHAKETQAHLYNFPSVIGYTVFNEGWGQFHADATYRAAKATDPTRLYDATSGWYVQHDSDFVSEHIYKENRVLTTTQDRPVLLSECGGYSYVVAGHSDETHETYGYGAAEGTDALTAAMETMYREMVLPSVPRGLCGCIYTQLSDVEGEQNGIYTYDRAVCKVDAARLAAVNAEVARAYADAAEGNA